MPIVPQIKMILIVENIPVTHFCVKTDIIVSENITFCLGPG